jgi:putative FmdB family regulatory protein
MYMPIYEYRCSDCSRTFEKIIWNSKGETIDCPFCKGKKVVRLLSTFSKAGGQTGEAPLPANCGSSSGFS